MSTFTREPKVDETAAYVDPKATTASEEPAGPASRFSKDFDKMDPVAIDRPDQSSPAFDGFAHGNGGGILGRHRQMKEVMREEAYRTEVAHRKVQLNRDTMKMQVEYNKSQREELEAQELDEGMRRVQEAGGSKDAWIEQIKKYPALVPEYQKAVNAGAFAEDLRDSRTIRDGQRADVKVKERVAAVKTSIPVSLEIDANIAELEATTSTSLTQAAQAEASRPHIQSLTDSAASTQLAKDKAEQAEAGIQYNSMTQYGQDEMDARMKASTATSKAQEVKSNVERRVDDMRDPVAEAKLQAQEIRSQGLKLEAQDAEMQRQITNKKLLDDTFKNKVRAEELASGFALRVQQIHGAEDNVVGYISDRAAADRAALQASIAQSTEVIDEEAFRKTSRLTSAFTMIHALESGGLEFDDENKEALAKTLQSVPSFKAEDYPALAYGLKGLASNPRDQKALDAAMTAIKEGREEVGSAQMAAILDSWRIQQNIQRQNFGKRAAELQRESDKAQSAWTKQRFEHNRDRLGQLQKVAENGEGLRLPWNASKKNPVAISDSGKEYVRHLWGSYADDQWDYGSEVHPETGVESFYRQKKTDHGNIQPITPEDAVAIMIKDMDGKDLDLQREQEDLQKKGFHVIDGGGGADAEKKAALINGN